MKRRDVLKSLGLSAGFLVVTPTVASLLQSCTNDSETWIPEFLSVEQGIIITNLVDVFIPKTDIPSATEVNVPQFIDRYFDKVLEDDQQAQVKASFTKVVALIKSEFNESINKVTEEDYKSLLDNHMKVKDEVDEAREANPEALIITTSELLNTLKSLAVTGYVKSQEIAKNVLVYDPIPSAYYCDDLEKLTGGKAYSL
ncbi:gluconate 2-dehydrogenase subunit 3 family protein [uncultured Algibacter sp.]|uniref:gluconate 2-dehydrogenase subunit 3 family protein n=1 Tax=uncultured Algibacter sp. TaxID=298659 RepID=UPI0026220DF2|nr:gluconate 2-dehydrogenase subunit 3 family protein [uncultured Algibacter sp.]